MAAGALCAHEPHAAGVGWRMPLYATVTLFRRRAALLVSRAMGEARRRQQIEREIEQLREMLFELEAEAERLRAPGSDPASRARAVEIIQRVLGHRWVGRLARLRRGAGEDSLLAGIEEITRRIREIDDRLVVELHRLERLRPPSKRSS